MTSKDQSNRRKTIFWRETVRKYSQTKRNLINFEITGATEQKKFSVKYMFKNKNGLSFDSMSIVETFKKYYSSLAENLMLKISKPPHNFGIQSVNNYCKKCNLKESLIFAKTESEKLFKILKTFDKGKVPGIEDLSGIFLKDGASLLTTPITQLCNLLISFRRFLDVFDIAKLKSLFKKGS